MQTSNNVLTPRLLHVRSAALVLMFALSLIYVPDVGHGFIKDDFNWLDASRIERPSDLLGILHDVGFYRPAVTLSFSINQALSGFNPLPYGLTNFALLVLCAVFIARVARALGMRAGIALFAAAVWSFNFHGINMAVLWISGRTSLLLSLFCLLAALALLRRRTAWVGIWTLFALLSKEEAVLLPFLLASWAWIWFARATEDRGLRTEDQVNQEHYMSWLQITRPAWPAFAALLVYFVLRSQTNAFLPSSAPAFYKLTFDPQLVGRNVLEYFDRSSSLAIALVIVASIIIGRLPRPKVEERRWIALGVTWLVLGYGLTVFVPVRSSLYAVLPSMGAGICAATLMSSLWSRGTARRQRASVVCGLLLPFVLLPVYWSRNLRWVREADLSKHVWEVLQQNGPTLQDGGTVLFIDDRSTRVNLRSSLGTGLEQAVRLATAKRLRVFIEPPIPPADATVPKDSRSKLTAIFTLKSGNLIRTQQVR